MMSIARNQHNITKKSIKYAKLLIFLDLFMITKSILIGSRLTQELIYYYKSGEIYKRSNPSKRMSSNKGCCDTTEGCCVDKCCCIPGKDCACTRECC